MKTNIVMQSVDRQIFGIRIKQETKTGFLSVSDLQEVYKIARGIHGWKDKQYQDLLNQKENGERVYYILKEVDLINTDFSVFMEEVEKDGVIGVLKKYGAYRVSGRGANKSVWANPYIWLLIAMELNPMLYAKTVIWLTDKLLTNRIEAGNFYKDFSRAISKFNPDYAKVAKALNYIVFNRHEPGIRNTASEKQLNELIDLEKKMAFAIDMGFVKSEKDLVDNLRKLWYNKWYEKIL